MALDALKYPLEDQNQTPGFVRFTPCDLAGTPLVAGNLEIVELYLPPSIQFADGANYEGFEMGVSGAVAIDVANKQGNSMDGIGANVKSQVEGLGQGLDAGTVISKMADSFSLVVPQEAVSGGTRRAVNPNTRVLFKSVALRTFQFSFKMIPTSEAEAEQIKAIVLSFRKQLYPTISGGAGGASSTSIGYLYPDMYLIEMTLGGREVPPKVKPSFLTAVSTNFNGSSGALLSSNGGNEYWSEVDIALSFGEGVTLNKADIVGGH